MTTLDYYKMKEVAEEVFISPFPDPTEYDALQTLNFIRAFYPESAGWHETKGLVKKYSDGSWRAIRYQVKYR